MFVFRIILGLSLYPGHCYTANDAISTRRQSRNSQLYYNNAKYQPSQDIYYNYEESQNNNYNYEPSQNSNYYYEPRQNSNYNYEPSQNSNYDYAPSQNINYNYAPNQKSNHNYESSENSSHNYAPSHNSNYNYATSQNSNNNYAPSQNSNNNYAPSQNANHNNKLNFNSYANETYAGAGLYGGQGIPSDRLVHLTKIITRQPYENERYYSQFDELSRNHQKINNIDRYRYPIPHSAEIGGTPVPIFREYTNYRQFDELSRDHQTISNIDRYRYPIAYNAEIGGTPVPMFREYPKFRSILPPFNITPYPKPVPFPPLEDSVVKFPDIESRSNNMTAIAASPDDLGFDDNPDPPVMVKREQFQWQVSVFSKEVSPRVRVCGGSLVTSSAIISAARCFWSVGALSAELFAAVAGAVASGQANNYEAYQYRRNVQDIKLPPRFRGAASRFQDDLAVAVLARPLPPALRPACVSFDWSLDEQQLAEGIEGMVNTVPKVLDKMGSWNLDMRNQRVPYIGVEECLQEAPEDQLQYVTSDKFCAGFRRVKKARACSSDTGSGLVYFQGSSSIPFLRGVASLQLDLCVTAFTHVATHRAFLLRHVGGLEAECARHYPGAGGAVNQGGGEKFICNCYC